jgi:hypothetical protein
MSSPFSKCPKPQKFPPATAIRISIPPARTILIFPAVARCCRSARISISRPLCFTLNAPDKSSFGISEKRARILRNRSRAASASIVSKFAALLDDGEFVNQALEFGNQMRGDKNRAAAGIAGLIRADDGLDEFAADNRVEAAGRLVQHEQFRFGTDRADERKLRALAFREARWFFSGRAESVSANHFRCRGSSVCGTRRNIPACRARSSTDKTRPCPAHRRAAISRRLRLLRVEAEHAHRAGSRAGARFSRHLIVVVLPAPLRPKKP